MKSCSSSSSPARSARRFALLALAGLAACRTAPVERPWRDAALETATWLEHVALPTQAGLAWAAVPDESREPDRSLYAGSPGVVLFFLELAATTGDAHWLALARAGADELVAGIPEHVVGEGDREVDGEEAGLYTGIAGVGFALGETWQRTGDERYRSGLERCIEALRASMQRNTTNDVIAGTAGIGFYLLWAAEALERPELLALARTAGDQLVAVAEPSAIGLDWAMTPDDPRHMPNFAHGTAGVAAFLARLDRAADAHTLPVAERGAAHLVAIAERSDGFRVYHHTPDGTELYYYGWCHGPCGTARLFRELSDATGAKSWNALEHDCARSILASGLPEQRLPGFWNNVSRCCGSAGVIEFFLDLHARDRDPATLAFAQRVARDLLARGQRDELGLRWPQAEHRVKPELIQAQTGLMQGAAGIGLALLHLDAAERGRARLVRLPDEPRP